MSQVRIQSNDTEVIIATMTLLKVLQTGLTDVLLKIHRTSDDLIFDFNDNTFKDTGLVSDTQVMTEIDATDLPGQYKYAFDTSAITNPVADDNYILIVTCASADNVPQRGEIKVGQFVDDIDASISSRASETSVTEILGLVQSNIRITPTNDASGNLTSGTMKIYPTKADAQADTNELHTYTITATVDANGYTTSYLCVKDS